MLVVLFFFLSLLERPGEVVVLQDAHDAVERCLFEVLFKLGEIALGRRRLVIEHVEVRLALLHARVGALAKLRAAGRKR